MKNRFVHTCSYTLESGDSSLSATSDPANPNVLFDLT